MSDYKVPEVGDRCWHLIFSNSAGAVLVEDFQPRSCANPLLRSPRVAIAFFRRTALLVTAMYMM